MLKNVSEAIRECLERAENCHRKAMELSHPSAKQDFLDLEQRWLSMAGRYEVAKRLSHDTGPHRGK